jgi:hypothetical protein
VCACVCVCVGLSVSNTITWLHNLMINKSQCITFW